jgi:PiT family inorganic phosphate transporter
MDISLLIFLSSGLFLGWSLGANDAANVFGTAVGSRMIRFTTAAIICTAFVILGAVISGAGAAHGLGELGKLNTLPGAFMAAFSAALTVYWMTRAGLPVSTTQAVVGAIVGWNWFSGSITDTDTLTRILATWVACPVLGAVFGALIYKLTAWTINLTQIHLLRLDMYTRLGLIVAGALGAYSLGANNIGNVMGVFVFASPFTDFTLGDLGTVTSVQQLFLIGAIAIGVGVFTYSKRVMMTVGEDILPLNPVGAFVVVISHSIVLFLFSSITLEHFLAVNGLPTIPLIPVSSSQAVVGAVIGIGLLKGGKGIRWRALANIASGWVTTPIIASVICFVMLFFLQNVFNQEVYRDVRYSLSSAVMAHLSSQGVNVKGLEPLVGESVSGGANFLERIEAHSDFPRSIEKQVIDAAEIHPMKITDSALAELDRKYISPSQAATLEALRGDIFEHRWQLAEALSQRSTAWTKREDNTLNKPFNKHLSAQLDYIFRQFSLE